MKTTRPVPSKTRPFTDAERGSMTPPRQTPGCTIGLAVAVVGWLITIRVIAAYAPPGNNTVPHWVMPVTLAAWLIPGAALGLWLQLRQPKKAASKAAQPSDAKAEIFTFTAVEAIRVKEFEDEGSHYFLRLADGNVLFLSGQYLYQYEIDYDEDNEEASMADKKFPCTQFDIVRHSEKGYVLDIIRRGTYLAPQKELAPFNSEHFKQGKVPEDMTYVGIPWDQIESTYS